MIISLVRPIGKRPRIFFSQITHCHFLYLSSSFICLGTGQRYSSLLLAKPIRFFFFYSHMTSSLFIETQSYVGKKRKRKKENEHSNQSNKCSWLSSKCVRCRASCDLNKGKRRTIVLFSLRMIFPIGWLTHHLSQMRDGWIGREIEQLFLRSSYVCVSCS